ncbi:MULTISPECIES: DUF938 domain-containing protein [unclassified Prochlorococcus]|uniref:DUF938 domain-containing protein n=1 Tax=unclassified Prochlorococcus TaxID=2627481 RepID=UPI00053378A7|nr:MULTISPECIES: DUF938 domain-containing protein [unclassified Prochlorococcus]KGG14917.1 hypothetical protein EV06_1982 [Prochlorococcus sp. MIT 0602]KGG15650.1 SAM-dependent methyltransferase [Prochlorococcus sp. MIT 0603]
MDERLLFPATQRNRDSIAEVLSKFLTQSGSVLEIASGSGEHGVIFQERFPNICWQTSDPEPSHRKSISAWINHQGLSHKMPQPIDLDVERRPWPVTVELQSSIKLIVCINMIHISPWSSTEALFEEAGILLKKGQSLILYGPFKINGEHISESNSRFDNALKAQNSSWGVRDLNEVSEIGMRNRFEKREVIVMPANNFSVVFQMS